MLCGTWNVPWCYDTYPAFTPSIINHHLADTRQYNNIRQEGRSTNLPAYLSWILLNIWIQTHILHTPRPLFATTLLCWEKGGWDCFTRKAVALLETTGGLPAWSFNNVHWTDGWATCRTKMHMYSVLHLKLNMLSVNNYLCGSITILLKQSV